ncbi:Transthyretin-like family protein [Ostertagia ostertagi]
MKYIILIALFGYCLAIRQQSVAITGKLRCGAGPASGVLVKLWDEDDGPDPDDLLDQGYTAADGSFTLKARKIFNFLRLLLPMQGSERELTTIDPVFKVYHDCDDGIKPGKRKVKFRIPNSYITNGPAAKRTFDIGVLNLETIFAKEERDLI